MSRPVLVDLGDRLGGLSAANMKRAPPHYEQQKTDPCPSVSLSFLSLPLLRLLLPTIIQWCLSLGMQERQVKVARLVTFQTAIDHRVPSYVQIMGERERSPS